EPPVAVRDGLEGDVVDARQAGRRAREQARQLAAVCLGEVALGGADLLFDQMEVVEQPFPGRRDPAARRDGRLQELAGGNQDTFVPGQAREELVAAAARALSRV